MIDDTTSVREVTDLSSLDLKNTDDKHSEADWEPDQDGHPRIPFPPETKEAFRPALAEMNLSTYPAEVKTTASTNPAIAAAETKASMEWRLPPTPEEQAAEGLIPPIRYNPPPSFEAHMRAGMEITGDEEFGPSDEMERELTLEQIGRPYKPFPVQYLPAVVRKYVQAGEILDVPDSFIALPVLSMLATAIGNSRWVQPREGFEEPPALWTAFIARPSSRKSAALRYAMSPLRLIEKRNRERYALEMTSYKQAAELRKQAGRRKPAEATEPADSSEPVEPQLTRYECSDITVEKMAEVLEDNARGVILAFDELGNFFGGMNAYRKGAGSDAHKLCETWSGGTLTVDRKTGERKSVYVARATVTVTGGVQPDVLLKALGREHHENGLAARFIFSYPPTQPGRWLQPKVDPTIRRDMNRLVEDLTKLTMTAEGEPVKVGLSDEAARIFGQFYEEMERAKQREPEEKRAQVLGKMVGNAARLALILHEVNVACGRFSTGRIEADEVTAALGIVEWFTYENMRVYGLMRSADKGFEANRYHAWYIDYARRNDGVISLRDAARKARSYNDAEALFELFEKRGWGKIETVTKGRNNKESVQFRISI